MIFSLSSGKSIGQRFRGIGLRLNAFYPSVKFDLVNIGVDMQAEHYSAIAFLSALIWAVLFTIFVGMLLSTVGSVPLPAKALLTFLSFFMVFMLLCLFYLIYPRMIAMSLAREVDRELIFVVRDMLIQVSSGIPLFTVLENIGNSSYPYISGEFRRVVSSVKGGGSLIDELESMAIRTQSDYLKKTAWQLVTAIRSGSNLAVTLRSIVHTLVEYQFSVSKSFNAELGFIILIFMLVAAVLPTIGTTVLVIFSVFGILGISQDVLIAVITLSFLGQLAIILYINFKRPNYFL